MATPKVSVVMSTYNNEKHLQEAIDSILSQTFRDFEFIIINDGSTDSSADIIRSYTDPRIRFIQNEKNIGLTRSLNKGLKLAKGQYIARMDADDIALAKKLETMLNFLEKNKDVGLVGSSYIEISEEGKELRTCWLPTDDKDIRKKLLVSNSFGSEMFRRTIGEKVGLYREEFRYAQDYDLCLRIAEVSKVGNIREPLYKYRVSLRSISVAKKAEQKHYANLIILRANIKERKKLFDLRRLVLKLKEYRTRRTLSLIEKTDRKSV